MEADLWALYRQMLRSRRFEQAVLELWNRGEISGEMHVGFGEEAVAAGVVDHLRDGDAVALDHRGTPPLVARGVDLEALLREFLGREDGLCRGMGGHMHLFSQPHLAATSGIVGAAGPAAAGFALAAQYSGKENVAVAFFGEGAVNQGMLLESLNLAVVWNLPVLFVCKDNQWAITTRSCGVTGGNLIERPKAFGMPARELDGSDVEAVWDAAGQALERARAGNGPSFLLARCSRPEGHFLGDPMLQIVRSPFDEMKKLSGPLFHSATCKQGGSVGDRVFSLATITSLIGRTAVDRTLTRRDPIDRARRKLSADKIRLAELEAEVAEEIEAVLEKVTTSPAPDDRSVCR